MSRDDDLRKIVLEFRSSVSTKFAEQDARLDGIDGRLEGLAHELRDRTRTMEAAILNSIRDLSSTVHRRFDDHETRLRRLEG
ncbi:hypothetical protein BH23ACT9_BH23ACT9_14470 [soil metagenome]